MGQGLSTEIGDTALYYTNLAELEGVLEQLDAGDARELELANKYIGEDGVVRARDLLAGDRSVRLLNLSYNRLNDNAVGVLCEALSHNTMLEVLNLSGNPLTEEGMQFISALLETTSTLHTLILYNCKLDDRCALILANALQRNKSLHTLNISMNDISDVAAGFFLQCLSRNKMLAVLEMKQNQISESNTNKIKDALAAHAEYRKDLASERAKRVEEDRRKEEEAERERLLKEEKRLEERESMEKQRQDMEEREKELAEEEEQLKRQHESSKVARRGALEASKKRKEEYIELTVSNAYKWRAKIQQGRSNQWQSGFTVDPRIRAANPNADSYGTVRTLQPCWCEPTDAPAGYGGQLHYHCKYEKEPDAFHNDDSVDRTKYEGCKRTGHPCISVGVYAKPLQKDTAATFFSSRSPHHVNE
eukprot:TRINITY_DN27209_c0_g1_i1.p1 TRINITY_DN27209_c0_g1~~TRINITY_DN27209_c0_g1_i1.p1  ORF type:complete len:419 (+),score=107.53 TRINITY_DN27209_c0_g1_i1:64-1320(+)